MQAPFPGRDFLTGSAVAAAGAAMLGLAAAEPAVAAEVRSGNWAADGSAAVTAEPSAATNATAADGTYREHSQLVSADDATPILPGPCLPAGTTSATSAWWAPAAAA